MPTISLQPGASGKDTWLWEANPNTNEDTSGGIVAGVFSGNASNSLIEFDLSSIPADAFITAATLRLRCTYHVGTDDVAIHRSLVSWIADQSTWNNRLTGTPWTGGAGGVAGTEYDATPTDTVSITSQGVDYDFDVTADVRDFYDGTHTNLGWWLIGSLAEGSRTDFRSSDNVVSSTQRPELIIEYQIVALVGQADGTSTAEADPKGVAKISGQADGTSTATATIKANNISGQADGTSTAEATLRGRVMGSGQADGTSTAEADAKGVFFLEGQADGTSTAEATGQRGLILRGSAAGSSIVSARAWGKAIHVAVSRPRNPAPLLEFTDGVGVLNLLDPRAIQSCAWRPTIAPYKGSGMWSDSPLANGRRLVYRRFANAVEVMEFTASGKDQDELIAHTRELLRWLEAAADYWTSRWATRPVYLRARSPYEGNIRHAIVHAASVPELEDVYAQPFFTARGRPTFDRLTLRLERGPWLDMPPGTGSCVAVSSIRAWTVAGWVSGAGE